MPLTKDQYLSDVWNKVTQYLYTNKFIEPEMVESFFHTSYIFELTEEKAIISVVNIIQKQVLRSLSDRIADAFIHVLDLSHPIEIEIAQEPDLEQRYSGKEIRYDENEFHTMYIQKDRTFENFVVGDCNRESQAAALACALNPGKFFNPLFIYGNSGLGKTHLMMAIANYVLKTDPSKKVYYTESLKFVETVVNAIRDNRIEAFKQYMFSIDLLLVDDIQFLAGKEKSHEVFFTIYNVL